MPRSQSRRAPGSPHSPKAQIADRKNGKRAPEEPIEAKKPPMKVARDASVRGGEQAPRQRPRARRLGQEADALAPGRASTAPVL